MQDQWVLALEFDFRRGVRSCNLVAGPASGFDCPVELSSNDKRGETFRSKHDPAGGRKGGCGPVGKIFIVGAVDLSAQGDPRPIRPAQIPGGPSKSLHAILERRVIDQMQMQTGLLKTARKRFAVASAC